MKNQKRYIKTPHKCIRKDTQSKRYQAIVKINGKQKVQTFDNIREAKKWVKEVKLGVNPASQATKDTSTLNHVWDRMQTLHFPSLALSTQTIWKRRYTLLSTMGHLKMSEITPSVINDWIYFHLDSYTNEDYRNSRGKASRCSFDTELMFFKTIFNWYKDEEEFEEESYSLECPIKKRHFKISKFKESPNNLRSKKIDLADVFRISSQIVKDVYRDLFLMQMYCAGRVGEIAGIQVKNIDLDRNSLLIKETISWCQDTQKFLKLNDVPKNGEPRLVHIHDEIKDIITRRLKEKAEGCNYLFHVDGKPLKYTTIKSTYNRACKKAGLSVTGTHFLRHSMATFAREFGGAGLESVVAMTGHKDFKLADHYSQIPKEAQKNASLNVLAQLKEQGLVGDTNFCYKDLGNILEFKIAK